MSKRKPAGTYPYRPSNGSEGCDFMEAFCMKCSEDTDECEIIFRSEVHDADDPEYPPEWISDDAVGLVNPRCTAFKGVADG